MLILGNVSIKCSLCPHKYTDNNVNNLFKNVIEHYIKNHKENKDCNFSVLFSFTILCNGHEITKNINEKIKIEIKLNDDYQK